MEQYSNMPLIFSNPKVSNNSSGFLWPLQSCPALWIRPSWSVCAEFASWQSGLWGIWWWSHRWLVRSAATYLCQTRPIHFRHLAQNDRILASHTTGTIQMHRFEISDIFPTSLNDDLCCCSCLYFSCSFQLGLVRCVPEWMWVLGTRVMCKTT